ncbi:MAG: metallophosphoesterase [Candidatus Kerfeldbacteria bacterium]|nr:metallophosphoesterase [Candidatus Kerfeldbacteria bacterium]
MVPAIILIITLVQAILAFAHLVVYKAIVAMWGVDRFFPLAFWRVVFVVLAISFVVASLIGWRYYNLVTSWFYTAAAVWLGFLLYFFLAACLYWLSVILLNNLMSAVAIAWLGKLALLAALIVGVYGLAHNNQLVVTSIKVQLPNLPAEWIGKKAVWVSDMHVGQVYDASFLDKIAAKIKTLKPDIIFVGGDVYDGVAFPVNTAKAPLAKLRAPWGTYFITGNHEEFGDNTKYLSVIKASGLRVLNNEMVNVHGLQLIGVDYNDTTNRQRYEGIIKSLPIDKNKPSILLKHAPTDIDVSAQAGINFQISSHTHRAQMFPLNLVTWLVYKGFDYGLHRFGQMTVYTSSGVGTWGPPLRVGSPSEIVLIEFK